MNGVYKSINQLPWKAGNSFYDNLADLFEAKSRRERRGVVRSPWSPIFQTARDHRAKFVVLKE